MVGQDPLKVRPWVAIGLGHVQRAIAIGSTEAGALELRGNLCCWSWLMKTEADPEAMRQLYDGARDDFLAATAADSLQAGRGPRCRTCTTRSATSPRSPARRGRRSLPTHSCRTPSTGRAICSWSPPGSISCWAGRAKRCAACRRTWRSTRRWRAASSSSRRGGTTRFGRIPASGSSADTEPLDTFPFPGSRGLRGRAPRTLRTCRLAARAERPLRRGWTRATTPCYRPVPNW